MIAIVISISVRCPPSQISQTGRDRYIGTSRYKTESQRSLPLYSIPPSLYPMPLTPPSHRRGAFSVALVSNLLRMSGCVGRSVQGSTLLQSI